jgi:DNA (cytosine-5)-methyltransferase 1
VKDKAKAYYNEIDRQKAAWLRELIKREVIAPGDVDERDIKEVQPEDLQYYTQCHFFAGVGVWSYALRLAGWPDDREVWTGSCPCQSFSVAGKKKGFKDERHLWPEWYRLIAEWRPGVIFGEQVASKDGLAWLDLVQDNLEVASYSVGPLDICAAGFGVPHIRQRLYFVADATNKRREWRGTSEESDKPGALEQSERLCDAGSMAHPDNAERRAAMAGRHERDRPATGRQQSDGESGECGEAHGAGPTNGHWGAVDWLRCTDGKWRPVEPGTFPLAHGAPARVGRLRGYGDAIVAEVAKGFIEAYLETQTEVIEIESEEI